GGRVSPSAATVINPTTTNPTNNATITELETGLLVASHGQPEAFIIPRLPIPHNCHRSVAPRVRPQVCQIPGEVYVGTHRNWVTVGELICANQTVCLAGGSRRQYLPSCPARSPHACQAGTPFQLSG